jgi:carboxypeptidase Q
MNISNQPVRVPFPSVVTALFLCCVTAAFAQSSVTDTNRAPSSSSRRNDPISRIRDEGLNRSQVMQTLGYLTEVIGPRLTGSPNIARANEWTRDKLASWGLTNAQLEPWGPFGRGWSLKRFSAQVIEPHNIPLIATPKAWTPGFEQPLTADVVFLGATNEAGLKKYEGKLKGAIVLASPIREVRAHWEPLASRISESNLLRLANASPSEARTNLFPGRQSDTPGSTNDARIGATFGRRSSRGSTDEAPPSTNATNVARGTGTNAVRGPAGQFSSRVLAFLTKEEVGLVLTPSSQGDGGTIFVASASTPESSRGTNQPSGGRRSVWATNAPAYPAQVALAIEDYNRLARMIQQGEKLKMTVDLQVQFHTDDLMAYNTIAEIPGSDLEDEIVMIGAHLDSWHVGTGATDNGAGVAATMEAVRILKALDLKPRRTIRIGLWTGEEEGLLGSRAYVAKHFGYYTNITNATVVRSPRDESNAPRRSRFGSSTNNATRKLIKGKEYEKFSAYYNLDNGTGKIRGVYMQGNESVRPLFRRWLQPFYDLGAETLTAAGTSGTDHLSFDGIGLPGFQFIQDPLEYWTRTHHSNADVYDRIQADDLKQASTIMAAFLWHTATMDEKLPRKPLPTN